ncbi:MAG: glucose-6-phosphate dehydrogenase [Patescibacteria group bacterium]
MINEVGPTHIIILGGSGDLSKRKLLPALIDLYCRGKLPNEFKITGVARTPRSDEEYRALVTEAIHSHNHDHSDEEIHKFCQHISYVSGSFDQPDTFAVLQDLFSQFETELGAPANRLFYLAVPPSQYGTIFRALHNSGFAPEDHHGCWSRILVEKPFGRDLETAKTLDEEMSQLFSESQIFRIDHYLAKEAVQNILSFRFANTLLQAAWDNEQVASVHITMKETVDVGHRVGFYEDVGALRDVGQNHLLQLLALVAMDQPSSLTPEAIRNNRARILSALRIYDESSLSGNVIRGQYEGYLEAEGVEHDSNTETYFELKAFVDTERWQDVPFYIKAGKALDEALVEIRVVFKDVATGPFETDSCITANNEVRLTIQPNQEMGITLNAKAPGLGFQLESRELAFTCQKGEEEIKNSYEKVLYDCILGDQTLFTKTEEVLASWKFISPILEHWQKEELHTYPKGSDGPARQLT